MSIVPCGSHDIDFKGDECLQDALHPNAEQGWLFCYLKDGHDGPHWDRVDGHWQLTELDGVEQVHLSRCQKVVAAQ